MSLSESLNVRRCHMCGEISESAKDILKCGVCSKSLLPFYYFDKTKVSDYSDNRRRPVNTLEVSPQGYGPIRGLTANW
jgi:hypothetical protein